MSNPVDMAAVGGSAPPRETPWTQPPLRKLAEKIHDNATAMHVLGNLILAHGDLMNAHKELLRQSVEAMKDSTKAIRELTQTIKDTLA